MCYKSQRQRMPEMGAQTFHHLTFIHPNVNRRHLITGDLITLKFKRRDTLSRSQESQEKSHNVKTSKISVYLCD